MEIQSSQHKIVSGGGLLVLDPGPQDPRTNIINQDLPLVSVCTCVFLAENWAISILDAVDVKDADVLKSNDRN